jgi:serine/threonine-protein kinase ULK/ATG1
MVGTPDSQIQRVPSSGKRPEDDELKPYVIVGDLGKGSFATVYKGYNEVRRNMSCYVTTQHIASGDAT